MTNKSITNSKKPILLILFFDVLGVWLGMGVPAFNILFGFIIGFYLYNQFFKSGTRDDFIKIYKFCLLGSFVTFVFMLMIWMPYIIKVVQKQDLTNTGIPLILYTPNASTIGWLVLMIVIVRTAMKKMKLETTLKTKQEEKNLGE